MIENDNFDKSYNKSKDDKKEINGGNCVDLIDFITGYYINNLVIEKEIKHHQIDEVLLNDCEDAIDDINRYFD